MKIAIAGPHGSGNRLVRRVVDHAFPEAECAVRSFPIGSNSKPPGRNWDPTHLMRKNFMPDFVFVTMREMSPWCMVREQRAGAVSVEAAIGLWFGAYQQIYESLGPFWERDDVQLVRYRDFFDLGVEKVIDRMGEMIPVSPVDTPFPEPIIDGDRKYHKDIEYWSEDRWIEAIKDMCKHWQRASG